MPAVESYGFYNRNADALYLGVNLVMKRTKPETRTIT